MIKYKYNINNLDCANCAREIEEFLNKDKRFKNVIVNFSTSKLSYESEEKISLEELNKLIRSVEPDAYVSILENNKQEYHLSYLFLGILLGLLGYFLNISNIYKFIFYILSYSILLYRPMLNSIKVFIKNKTINENFLITISCLGAFFIGEYLEGIMVIVLYTIGKILESKAINNSRRSIKNLIDIKSDYALKKENNKVIDVAVEEIEVGDILVVKKGEKIPVDGVVIKGNTSLDTSVLTGESDLVKVKENDNVLSGSVNMDGIIEIKATSKFNDSTAFKILSLLEEAGDKKAKTETMVSKISRVYTPLVIILAILIMIFMPLITNISYHDSLYRGLTFLVISCPCAIAISVPLAYFTGIGVASKKGILIKGSNYLDNLSNAKNIIFDKTGTLTNGSFILKDITVLDSNYSKEEIIDILVKGESLSNHPIAKSIMKLKNEKVRNNEVLEFKEIDGQGISFVIDDKTVLIGNGHVCACDRDVNIHVNINGNHVASVEIFDGIKDGAVSTIEKLKKYGLKTYMFTGDKKNVSLNIGNKLNIDEIKYEMLPTDKYHEYELVAKNKDVTIFVGDGINDAPVLKRADIGISMGGVGQASAIEASDIVLMNDDLDKIPEAIAISNYTRKIIKQNLFFAIMVKIVILLLSVFGYANMWFAVFADTGVTLLTVLNTFKILRKFKV